MLPVRITEQAAIDMDSNTEWWASNRSTEQAKRWYLAIRAEIRSIGDNPQRFSVAPEQELTDIELRQLFFGLGNRITHRVLFLVDSEAVTVLRVRHVSQVALSKEEL